MTGLTFQIYSKCSLKILYASLNALSAFHNGYLLVELTQLYFLYEFKDIYLFYATFAAVADSLLMLKLQIFVLF